MAVEDTYLKHMATIINTEAETEASSGGFIERMVTAFTLSGNSQSARVRGQRDLVGPTGWRKAVVNIMSHKIDHRHSPISSFYIGAWGAYFGGPAIAVGADVSASTSDSNGTDLEAEIVVAIDFFR